jgi:hypothetical protein
MTSRSQSALFVGQTVMAVAILRNGAQEAMIARLMHFFQAKRCVAKVLVSAIHQKNAPEITAHALLTYSLQVQQFAHQPLVHWALPIWQSTVAGHQLPAQSRQLLRAHRIPAKIRHNAKRIAQQTQIAHRPIFAREHCARLRNSTVRCVLQQMNA